MVCVLSDSYGWVDSNLKAFGQSVSQSVSTTPVAPAPGLCAGPPVQVKLLKCLVDNIVVDISFNQMGGLITLNFLEEINNLIGNSNIFKRSIILVSSTTSTSTTQQALAAAQRCPVSTQPGRPGGATAPAGSSSLLGADPDEQRSGCSARA